MITGAGAAEPLQDRDNGCPLASGETSPITVVLGHRSRLIAAALSTMITQSADMHVIAESCHGELLTVARRRKPRVVVFDHDLAGMTGVDEFCCRLCAALPHTRVLVITDQKRSAGKLGQLVKLAPQVGLIAAEAAPADLISGIRQLARGEPVLDVGMALAAFTADPSPLTDREREVLLLASDGAPVKDIASRLHLSKGTVRNHLCRVLTKTGGRTRIEAIRIAQEAGWI